MRKLLYLGIFLFSFSIPSYAQFIGINLGMPMLGGGSPSTSVPIVLNNVKDDSGNLVKDDSGNQIQG